MLYIEAQTIKQSFYEQFVLHVNVECPLVERSSVKLLKIVHCECSCAVYVVMAAVMTFVQNVLAM